jgi:hypothetical protein
METVVDMLGELELSQERQEYCRKKEERMQRKSERINKARSKNSPRPQIAGKGSIYLPTKWHWLASISHQLSNHGQTQYIGYQGTSDIDDLKLDINKKRYPKKRQQEK